MRALKYNKVIRQINLLSVHIGGDYRGKLCNAELCAAVDSCYCFNTEESKI